MITIFAKHGAGICQHDCPCPKPPSFVGKYTSTMVRIWDCKSLVEPLVEENSKNKWLKPISMNQVAVHQNRLRTKDSTCMINRKKRDWSSTKITILKLFSTIHYPRGLLSVCLHLASLPAVSLTCIVVRIYACTKQPFDADCYRLLLLFAVSITPSPKQPIYRERCWRAERLSPQMDFCTYYDLK